MNKLLRFLAIFSIVISASLSISLSCDSDFFCCDDMTSSTSQCQTCPPHHDSGFDGGNIHPVIVFAPSIVGQIFFEDINTYQISVVFSQDRPPALNS